MAQVPVPSLARDLLRTFFDLDRVILFCFFHFFFRFATLERLSAGVQIMPVLFFGHFFQKLRWSNCVLTEE